MAKKKQPAPKKKPAPARRAKPKAAPQSRGRRPAAPVAASPAPPSTAMAEFGAKLAVLEHVLLVRKICTRDDLRRARAFVDMPGVRS